MKISIIKVVYNGEQYLKDAIVSVLAQDYQNIEYIIIDGGSTDNTLSIIENYKDRIAHFVSGKDKGMYDAMNKGIALATGEVIGMLNADDMLANETVITEIAKHFMQTNADGVYGNLNYINATNPSQIIRKWISKQHHKKDIELGWMPAHPTLYLKRELFAKHGNYSLGFGTAADYELMTRFLYKHSVKAVFLDQLIVNMRNGGVSNSSLKQRYLAFVNDYKAARVNNVPYPFFCILNKKLSKITQFLHRN